MKKIIILAALSVFAASSAFAAGISSTNNLTMDSTLSANTGLSVWGGTTASNATTGTNLIGKTSTGVGVFLLTASTGYAMLTQHKSGTKAFGSSYDSTSIYTIPVTAGTPTTVIPTTANSAIFVGTGGWTSM
jgi:hypothetical protein